MRASAADPGAIEAAAGIVEKSAPDLALDEIRYLPTVPDPEKIICIGVNYGDRHAEYKDDTGAAAYPSVFLATQRQRSLTTSSKRSYT